MDLVERIISDRWFTSDSISLLFYFLFTRESTRESSDACVTLRFCKSEFLALAFLFVSASTAVCAFTVSAIFLDVNDSHLSYNFFIVFLPFDGVSFNWLLNYLQQAVFEVISTGVLFIYFPLTMLLMNHTCWGFANINLLVENLRTLIPNHGNELINTIEVHNQMNIIIQKSYTVIAWRDEVQELLKFNFLMEFSVLSFILCMLTFTLTVDPSATFLVYFFTPVMLAQLFAYCWMGNQVDDSINEYVAILYDIPWYFLEVRHQKDIQMIILNAQKIRGFNGIFNQVGMVTFQKVRILCLKF